MGPETKVCQNCKQNFVIEPEDFDFYKKMEVPPPTWCPECRLERRMVWRNDHFLFKRKSGKDGRTIFSTYPEAGGMNIWEVSDWLSDSWDQNSYGREYDFSRPFFVQFQELIQTAPVPSRGLTQPIVNSDYSNNSSYLKDCYLVFGSVTVENSACSDNLSRSKECVACSFLQDSELCYECFFCQKCYQVRFSSYCEDSRDLWFCKECVGCSDCVGSVGLRNKQYYIFNQPYSKETYLEKLKELKLEMYSSAEELKQQLANFALTKPVRYSRSKRNENVVGEYITNSKNVTQSYFIDGGENLKYCHSLYAKPSKDCMDQYRYGDNCELMYECGSCGGHSSRCRFSYQVYNNSLDVQYSLVCMSLSHSFGCVGLHNKQYCILNKQYTKEEYEVLLPKIIAHMNDMPYADKLGRIYRYGEFFPPEISPLAYNETIAQEYFPLTPEAARATGFIWRDPEKGNYISTLVPEKLAEKISDVSDDITKEVIACAHGGTCAHFCATAFRIIPQELALYRVMKVPLPRICPNCRYFERITQRAPIKLWPRTCECGGLKSTKGDYTNVVPHVHGDSPCGSEFQTSYSPERPEIVYCENCYQQEVT